MLKLIKKQSIITRSTNDKNCYLNISIINENNIQFTTMINKKVMSVTSTISINYAKWNHIVCCIDGYQKNLYQWYKKYF